MSEVFVRSAEEKQPTHSWLMAPDEHVDGSNYCHVPKEMRDTRGPNKTSSSFDMINFLHFV